MEKKYKLWRCQKRKLFAKNFEESLVPSPQSGIVYNEESGSGHDAIEEILF